MGYERRGDYAGYSTARGEIIKRINAEVIDDWFEKYNRLVTEGEEKGQIYV